MCDVGMPVVFVTNPTTLFEYLLAFPSLVSSAISVILLFIVVISMF